jgi:hypothetical protein
MTKLINDHRQHLYNGDINSGRTFEKGEVIPEGYFDRPNATKWDNKPLPVDQWPRKVEPEPAPIYVSPPTPLEHEEPKTYGFGTSTTDSKTYGFDQHHRKSLTRFR